MSLEAELGFEAVKSLQILWCFAAQNKPSGELCGMPKMAVAIASRFSGDREAFVDALVNLRFLDFDGKVYSLHDWEEHNGFAASSEQRSDAARKAANAKWEKKRGIKSTDAERNADLCETQCDSHKLGDAERNAPSPSPSPSPSPYLKEEVFQTSVGHFPTPPAPDDSISAISPEPDAPDQPPGKPDPIPYRKIIDHLNAQCNCQFKPTSNATKRHIRARWAEGFRLPDFEAVIDHKHEEWAQDAKMCMFLRPETLFSTKFEGYLQAARNGPPVGTQAAQGSRNGARRQGTARQQYMQDVGNLLENINEIANGGRPMRLGQAAEPLPGIGPQQSNPVKLGGRLGGPAG